MDNKNVIVAAIVGLVLIELLTLYYKKEPIEQALLQQTALALASADAQTAIKFVEFDGRDATLRGEVASEEEKNKLETVVSDVADVRVVNNQLRIKEKVASAPAPEPESVPLVKGFRMKQGPDGGIHLTGMVNDASTRNKIVSAVLDAFPAKSIDNQIQLASGEPQLWVPPLLKAISAISVVDKPEIDIPEDGDKLVLRGNVAAAVQKVAVLKDLSEALPATLFLDEHLNVASETRDPALLALERRIQDLQTTTRIQFKINTANLADLSKQVLNQVADILKEAPDAQIEVQGHTDNLGQTALNMELSQHRADAVRAYLISQGVEAARLTAVGYGPTRPVATNSTRQGRITNRRVVFSLKGGS